MEADGGERVLGNTPVSRFNVAIRYPFVSYDKDAIGHSRGARGICSMLIWPCSQARECLCVLIHIVNNIIIPSL